MYNYCQRPRRTIAEIMFDFTPTNIPLDYILDVFPMLRPRSFSIASSLKVKEKNTHNKRGTHIHIFRHILVKSNCVLPL